MNRRRIENPDVVSIMILNLWSFAAIPFGAAKAGSSNSTDMEFSFRLASAIAIFRKVPRNVEGVLNVTGTTRRRFQPSMQKEYAHNHLSSMPTFDG